MLDHQISGFYVHDFPEVKQILTIYNQYNKILEQEGYLPRYFPTVGLESDFIKEKDHFKLNSETYTLSGKPWILKPTSQSVAYPLTYGCSTLETPFKWYQVGSVFRNESKVCRKYIRSKEITFFHQAHAIFSNETEAKAQITLILDKLSFFLENLGVPFMINLRPPQDTFPGALQTYAFDTILKSGRVVQIATVHYLGDNFSKVYKPGVLKYYGICFGTSERLLGVLKDLYDLNLKWVLNPYAYIRFGQAHDKVSIPRIPCKSRKHINRILKKTNALFLYDNNFFKDLETLEPITYEASLEKISAKKTFLMDQCVKEFREVKPNIDVHIYGVEIKLPYEG